MPTWAPTGERLAFTVGGGECGDEPHIGIISSYRGHVSPVARGQLSFEPDWSPGGRTIAFSADYRTIVVIDLKTGKKAVLHDGQHPRFSPDSRKIVFADSGIIYVMNAVDGSELTRLAPP